MTVPLPQSFEMMADLGTVTVCRLDAAIDYAAAVSAADNAALREALVMCSTAGDGLTLAQEAQIRAALKEAT